MKHIQKYKFVNLFARFSFVTELLYKTRFSRENAFGCKT